jgi:hypothetical protein
MLTGEGERVAEEQIKRRRESLVLHKSFNTPLLLRFQLPGLPGRRDVWPDDAVVNTVLLSSPPCTSSRVLPSCLFLLLSLPNMTSFIVFFLFIQGLNVLSWSLEVLQGCLRTRQKKVFFKSEIRLNFKRLFLIFWR